MKIAVGSENPVKINAVAHAFQLFRPKKTFKVIGVKVSSGVSDQPMSDAECIKGATVRAKKSLKILKADFGVGIEGGVNNIGSKWFDCGWVVVTDKKGRMGIGSSARMETPKIMIKMIKKGMELGDVGDKLFNRKNSKQAEGHFGMMTDGVVTRKDGYTQAVVMALSRFIHPEMF